MNHPIEQLISKPGFAMSALTEAPYFMSIKEEFTENGKGVWVVDYDQIESPRRQPLVDECRGIVICQATRKVVCWPFRRFYNLGEFPDMEKDFDWNTAVTHSKEDGSLIKVYWFDGKWRIATRGTAFGNNTITNLVGEQCDITFRDLFLRTINFSDDEFQNYMDDEWLRCTNLFFELCTKENRVVTKYEDDCVYHIGVRYKDATDVDNPFPECTARELETSPSWALLPDVVSISSFSEALKSAADLKNLREGFVLSDDNGLRFKVKAPAYDIAHRVRGNQMNGKRAVDLILMNEHHEFLAVFDEYTEYVMKYADRLYALGVDCKFEMAKYGSVESQKDFALAIKDLSYSGLLFTMRKGSTFEEAFDKLTTNGKYRLLGAE